MSVQRPGTAVTAGRAWRASGLLGVQPDQPAAVARLLLTTSGALTP